MLLLPSSSNGRLFFGSIASVTSNPAPFTAESVKLSGSVVGAADPVGVIQDKFVTRLELSALQQLGELLGDVLIRRPAEVRRAMDRRRLRLLRRTLPKRGPG